MLKQAKYSDILKTGMCVPQFHLIMWQIYYVFSANVDSITINPPVLFADWLTI